jgi:carbon monoxide dehydrogenase subunit G
MEFENTFIVQAPVEQVWELLLDVERIAPCMPGAQVLEQTGEDAYKVAVKVRLGPMTMNYKGDVEILDRDAVARQATMRAKAREARGQGTASADIRMALHQRDGGTEASIITSMQMSGKAATMGQGVIRDVAAALTETFAQNLAEMASAAARIATAGMPPMAEPATASATQAASAAPPPPPPPPAPDAAEADAALPVGTLVGAVVTGRLRDPRALGALAVALFGTGYLLGRRRG